MSRLAVTFATAVVVALALAAVGASATAGKRSGVRGQVIDTTCLGPCTPDGDSRPYAGSATIAAKPRSRRARAAEREIDGGEFRLPLRPGRYLVRVRIDDPCWQTDSEKLRVHRGEFRRLRLEVANECIR